MKKLSFRLLSFPALPGGSPARDWNVMLSVFGLLLLCGVVFSGYVYWAIANDSLSPQDSIASSEGQALDPKAISSVIASYDAESSRTQNLISGGQLLVDPSR